MKKILKIILNLAMIIVPFIFGVIYTAREENLPVIVVGTMNLSMLIVQYWVIYSFPKGAKPGIEPSKEEGLKKIKLNGIIFVFCLLIILLMLLTDIDKIPKDASLTAVVAGVSFVSLLFVVLFTSFLGLILGYLTYRKELSKR